MEIKRDLYLKKLIDSKHNGMIKVVDVRDLSPGRDELMRIINAIHLPGFA